MFTGSTFKKLQKSYAEIAQHLDPESRAHFEAIPNERRDWFKRMMFEDSLVPGAMNQHAYKTMGVQQRPGVHVRLDMNDLKALNDTYGHERGNDAIKGFGGAALQAARSAQGQLFRTGGDEFHAHFQTPEQAYSFLRGLHSGVSALVPVAGTHKVSFSAGVGQTPEESDSALYRAKATKTQRFGDLRRDPQAITGHGQHFVHSMLPGAAGPVALSEEPAIPEGVKKPGPQVPMPMPTVNRPL